MQLKLTYLTSWLGNPELSKTMLLVKIHASTRLHGDELIPNFTLTASCSSLTEKGKTGRHTGVLFCVCVWVCGCVCVSINTHKKVILADLSWFKLINKKKFRRLQHPVPTSVTPTLAVCDIPEQAENAFSSKKLFVFRVVPEWGGARECVYLSHLLFKVGLRNPLGVFPFHIVCLEPYLKFQLNRAEWTGFCLWITECHRIPERLTSQS